MPWLERLAVAAAPTIAALAFLGACAADPDAGPATDAGAERGQAGSGSAGSGGSGGSAGTSGTPGDAAGGATATDGGADAAPCIIDPDATVNCPPDLPPDDNCPDAAPSYTTEVAAIIERKCTVCHRVGGLDPVDQFDTYAKIKKNMNNIHMLTQVYTCQMPQACGEPLTQDEKFKLLQWLVCGAPAN